MNIEEINNQINKYKEEGKSLFTTSSFQSHSLVLLHILSRVDKNIPVYFLNTGYHFPETIEFVEQITKTLNINTRYLNPLTPKSLQRDEDGRLLFTSDPDYCCYLNKTQPMEQVMMEFDIWINGVRADQSFQRKSMQLEQEAPHGVTRFHPMLDWSAKNIYDYLKEFDLPRHPLESQGYMSIGCEPCTKQLKPEMQEREARWYGMNKTECGLHTDLINQ